VVGQFEYRPMQEWGMPSRMFPVIVLFIAARLAAGQSDIVTLSQKWGRAGYSSCDFEAGVFQGRGRLSLRCTPNTVPPLRDITAERRLTTKEAETLTELIRAGNLYDGGHTGFGNGLSEGPWETLSVHCCGRKDTVVLVIDGNDTFRSGSNRYRLLGQLRAWNEELKASAERKLRR